jgi:lycopene cyclase domain-containing protein
LNKHYLYLAIDIGSFIVPFIFSFYPKINFSKKFKYVLPGIAITAILFIAWDIAFTAMGVWGFNPDYVTGIYFFNLPLEEVLFFFCVPYACFFTYFALKNLIETDYLYPHHEIISSILIFALLLTGGYFMNKAYTGVTFMLTAMFLAYQMLKLRPRYMGRFYFAFAILLIPFLIVNGILTGAVTDQPVVWYNDKENLGIRLATIPLEDTFYGMLMILLSITIAEELENKFEG